MALAEDPAGFAEGLLRPMPRRRNRFADLGTAFHAWVEQYFGRPGLLDIDELPGAADASAPPPSADLDDLRDLIIERRGDSLLRLRDFAEVELDHFETFPDSKPSVKTRLAIWVGVGVMVGVKVGVLVTTRVAV